MTKDYSVGSVELIDIMGSDDSICDAARVTTSSEGKDNKGLINYLMKNNHMSPFEFAELQFRITCPIFIARQWFRHRAGSYAEKSMRYDKTHEIEYYIPPEERFPDDDLWKESTRYSKNQSTFEELISDNYPSELVRGILPQAMFTTFMFKCNLRNIFNFLEQRLNENAQYEIRELANLVANIVKEKFPLSYEAFEEHILHSIRLSQTQNKKLKQILELMIAAENVKSQKENNED